METLKIDLERNDVSNKGALVSLHIVSLMQNLRECKIDFYENDVNLSETDAIKIAKDFTNLDLLCKVSLFCDYNDFLTRCSEIMNLLGEYK